MSTDHESRLAWILALAADANPRHIAETHGVVIGLLCANPEQSNDQLAEALAGLQVGDWTSTRIQAQLGPALAALRGELASPDLDFRPLLPTDDRPLPERAECIGAWASGFMAGFGAGGPALDTPEANEALRMISQITRAFSDPAADSETEEQAFAELSEFLRVATLLLREEGLRQAPQ